MKNNAEGRSNLFVRKLKTHRIALNLFILLFTFSLLCQSCETSDTKTIDSNVQLKSELNQEMPNRNIGYQSVSIPSPPDLSRCTHLEITIYNSKISQMIDNSKLTGLLNETEKKQIFSLQGFTVEDSEIIESFSNKIQKTRYSHTGGSIGSIPDLSVECYQNDELIETITDFGYVLVTKDHHYFNFEKGTGGSGLYKIPEKMQPFILRCNCGEKLLSFYSNFVPLLRSLDKRYPVPDKWCDDNIEYCLNRFPNRYKDANDPNLLNRYICPNASEGKCHYAMNPNCKPDSPDDMVLLFETKDGWNQNGGPELFTFDNHEPKCGCVLFNDGTVKFIRTEEELNNLRWK